MQLTKISRSKSFEMVNGLGLKLWDKLSAEMSIEPGEDPKEGYKSMDDMIEEVHKESYREYTTFQEPVIQIEKPSVKLNPDATVIEQYKVAVSAGNDVKIKLIENIYNLEKLKDAIKE